MLDVPRLLPFNGATATRELGLPRYPIQASYPSNISFALSYVLYRTPKHAERPDLSAIRPR